MSDKLFVCFATVAACVNAYVAGQTKQQIPVVVASLLVGVICLVVLR